MLLTTSISGASERRGTVSSTTNCSSASSSSSDSFLPSMMTSGEGLALDSLKDGAKSVTHFLVETYEEYTLSETGTSIYTVWCSARWLQTLPLFSVVITSFHHLSCWQEHVCFHNENIHAEKEAFINASTKYSISKYMCVEVTSQLGSRQCYSPVSWLEAVLDEHCWAVAFACCCRMKGLYILLK